MDRASRQWTSGRHIALPLLLPLRGSDGVHGLLLLHLRRAADEIVAEPGDRQSDGEREETGDDKLLVIAVAEDGMDLHRGVHILLRLRVRYEVLARVVLTPPLVLIVCQPYQYCLVFIAVVVLWQREINEDG